MWHFVLYWDHHEGLEEHVLHSHLVVVVVVVVVGGGEEGGEGKRL